jgi:hypothetical protein
MQILAMEPRKTSHSSPAQTDRNIGSGIATFFLIFGAAPPPPGGGGGGGAKIRKKVAPIVILLSARARREGLIVRGSIAKIFITKQA